MSEGRKLECGFPHATFIRLRTVTQLSRLNWDEAETLLNVMRSLGASFENVRDDPSFVP
jgi:hypothetical protein